MLGGESEERMSPSEQVGDSGGRSVAVAQASLSLLHFDFRWSQEGLIFLLFLPLCIAVHTTISTFLKVFLPLPFAFGFFLSFNFFFPLSLPFMHLFGFSLLPFNFQLSKEFHGLFVYCLFEQLWIILLYICSFPSFFNCFFRSFTVCSTYSFPA